MEDECGEGGFGHVFRATHKRTGIVRAIKKIPKSTTSVTDFENEIRALIRLDHPHIIKVIEYFEGENNFWVVEQLCESCDLWDYVVKSMGQGDVSTVSSETASIIIRQCLKSLQGCHFHGLIHRDIKPENFMLTEVVGGDLSIMLIDFGLAKSVSGNEKIAGVCGTPAYMAPEMDTGRRKYDAKVDIWSLGCVLFFIFATELFVPDTSPERELALMRPGYVEERLEFLKLKRNDISGAAIDIMRGMLQVNPERRLTAAEALMHPFICDHRLSVMGKKEISQKPATLNIDFLSAMRMFAQAPIMIKLALHTMAHVAAVFSSETGLTAEADFLASARFMFRRLDWDGYGSITLERLVDYFKVVGTTPPCDIAQVFVDCTSRDSQNLETSAFVAICLISTQVSDELLRETFRTLDRRGSGVLEYEVLMGLVRGGLVRNDAETLRAELPKGYLNYTDFEQLIRGGAATVAR